MDSLDAFCVVAILESVKWKWLEILDLRAVCPLWREVVDACAKLRLEDGRRIKVKEFVTQFGPARWEKKIQGSTSSVFLPEFTRRLTGHLHFAFVDNTPTLELVSRWATSVVLSGDLGDALDFSDHPMIRKLSVTSPERKCIIERFPPLLLCCCLQDVVFQTDRLPKTVKRLRLSGDVEILPGSDPEHYSTLLFLENIKGVRDLDISNLWMDSATIAHTNPWNSLAPLDKLHSLHFSDYDFYDHNPAHLDMPKNLKKVTIHNLLSWTLLCHIKVPTVNLWMVRRFNFWLQDLKLSDEVRSLDIKNLDIDMQVRKNLRLPLRQRHVTFDSIGSTPKNSFVSSHLKSLTLSNCTAIMINFCHLPNLRNLTIYRCKNLLFSKMHTARRLRSLVVDICWLGVVSKNGRYTSFRLPPFCRRVEFSSVELTCLTVELSKLPYCLTSLELRIPRCECEDLFLAHPSPNFLLAYAFVDILLANVLPRDKVFVIGHVAVPLKVPEKVLTIEYFPRVE